MQKTSEVYKNLYHYTNYSGLLGILDNDLLWSTHFKFLNDLSEIKLFMEERLPDILYPRVFQKYKEILNSSNSKKRAFDKIGRSLESVVIYDTSVAIESLYSPLKEQIYITSFCGESDDNNINKDGLLSQWRAYGRDGGFAIIFDTAAIEQCMELEGKKFSYGYGATSDLVYSHDEKKFKREFSKSIDVIADFVCHVIDSTIMGKNFVIKGDPYSAFLNCISRYKHRGFSEENEVRLVLHVFDNISKDAKKNKIIYYREKNGEKIPYIKLFDSKQIKLPIKKIIVGPHREKESRAAFLRTKLKKTNIEIAVSEIPYVD